MTDPGRSQFLYYHGTRDEGQTIKNEIQLRAGRHHAVTIDVGNRKWELVATATPEFIAAKQTWQPNIVLLVGFSFTLLLTWFVNKTTIAGLLAESFASSESEARKQAEAALTELKRAEGALRESEQKFKMIFNQSHDLIALLSPEGILIDINWTAIKFSGLKKEDLIGRPFWETAWWQNSVTGQKQLREAIAAAAAGRTAKFETNHVAADNSLHTFDVAISPVFDESGKVTLLIPEGRDISVRKSIEQRLQESEDRLRELIDQSPIGLALCRKDGSLVSANPSYVRIIGYGPDEVLKLSYWDITPKEYAEEEEQQLQQLEVSGRYGPYEKEYRHKDGHLVPVRLNGMLVVWDGEEYIWSSVEDITALKEAEAEKTFLTEQLRQSQKMEAIGTLAGGIAHDFNNMLSAILGYTELTLRNPDCDPKSKRNLGYVLSAAERGRDLIKQILIFSRKDIVQQHPIEIHSVVREAVNLLSKTIPATITINLNIDEQTGRILADETQIHQVVMNLCTNAYHSMLHQGGKISIGLKHCDVDLFTAAKYPNLRQGSYALLTVADTGEGMAAGVLARNFEPFFTTKAQGKGTGMGLAVVHGIIQSHDGAIGVESSVGEGTTFSVFFPLVSETAVTKKQLSGKPAPGRGDEHILWVDDEPMLVALGREALEPLGYKLTTTTSAREAISLFQADPSSYDLIVTDQTMPEMTGDLLARTALAVRANVPVIICTGHSDVLNAKDALSIGAKAFLMKPLEVDVLVEEIRQVLDSAA